MVENSLSFYTNYFRNMNGGRKLQYHYYHLTILGYIDTSIVIHYIILCTFNRKKEERRKKGKKKIETKKRRNVSYYHAATFWGFIYHSIRFFQLWYFFFFFTIWTRYLPFHQRHFHQHKLYTEIHPYLFFLRKLNSFVMLYSS